MPGRKVTHSEEWWAEHPDVPRCQGHYSTTGERCRRQPIPGGAVCGHHGGLAPHVMNAAAVRVKMSAEEMLDRLYRMLDDPNVEAREKIKVAQDWLNRAGLTSAQTHIVGIATGDPIEQLFADLAATPGALAPPRENPLVVEAELAPDDATWAPDEDDENPPEEPRPALPPAPSTPAPPAAEGSVSSRPPRWLAEALEQLI